jgi:hypothetical protein
MMDELNQPVLDANGAPVLQLLPQYDFDGVVLQDAFTKHCRADATSPLGRDVAVEAPCVSGDHPDSVPEYYSRVFSIASDDLAATGKLAALGISADNYNYRIRDLAVNLVGSNVQDCSRVSGDQSQCYSTAFVPFDLFQRGAVELNDHGGRTREFRLPRGGIRNGQALAAERLITTPVATADMDLLAQYWAHEFAGRPLQGVFEFRLYHGEALRFDQLQDVQLVVQLDYWSPFEVVP